jgi:hypothetical protein
MIDPDRVMQMAYLPGEKVRAEGWGTHGGHRSLS